MTSLLDVQFETHPSIVTRKVAGEVILVPVSGRIEEPCLYTLSETAAFLWEQLNGKKTGQDLARALESNFEVEKAQADTDVQIFLEQLQTINAIRSKE